jgi:hypothetical protein
MDVYKPWKNILPMVSFIADCVEEWYWTSRFFCFIFAYRMPDRYELECNWAQRCSAPFRFGAKMIDFHSTMISFILALILAFFIFI